MNIPIEKKENWMLFECRSLWEAKEILKENGINWDCMYENIHRDKNRFGGVVNTHSGVHVYFNNGNGTNVAYYTPIMERLGIINRPDGTPEENRRYL